LKSKFSFLGWLLSKPKFSFLGWPMSKPKSLLPPNSLWPNSVLGWFLLFKPDPKSSILFC